MNSKTEQKPLTARRGGDPHDFSQARSDWEAAVFDDTDYYFACALGPRRYVKFSTFAAAVEFARNRREFCLYGITPSGRSTLFDRVKWDEWLERERINTEMKK